MTIVYAHPTANLAAPVVAFEDLGAKCESEGITILGGCYIEQDIELGLHVHRCIRARQEPNLVRRPVVKHGYLDRVRRGRRVEWATPARLGIIPLLNMHGTSTFLERRNIADIGEFSIRDEDSLLVYLGTRIDFRPVPVSRGSGSRGLGAA
jgi:hypothetical protein